MLLESASGLIGQFSRIVETAVVNITRAGHDGITRQDLCDAVRDWAVGNDRIGSNPVEKGPAKQTKSNRGLGQGEGASTDDEPDAASDEMRVDAGEPLARATPIAPGECTNNRHPVAFAGVTLPSLMIKKRVRRFSPAAPAASPHHRAIWDLRLIPACTVTGEILLGDCGNPECSPTGWSATPGIDRCEHCTADLTKSSTTSIPDETRVVLGGSRHILESGHGLAGRHERTRRVPCRTPRRSPQRRQRRSDHAPAHPQATGRRVERHTRPARRLAALA